MPRARSLLGRMFEPFGGSLWILFLVWTALVAVVWIFGFGPVEIGQRVGNQGLREALVWMAGVLDPFWLVLAAANVYLCVVAVQGLTVARQWAAIILVGASAIAWISVATGWPLGPIVYTHRLGFRLGPVPLGLLLLWLILVLCSRETAARFLPRASHAQLAAATGLLVLASALNLEMLAWKTRSWWFWYPATVPVPSWPPLRNYATWLIAGTVFAYQLRERNVASTRAPGSAIPVFILLLMNGVFAVTHLASWLRR